MVTAPRMSALRLGGRSARQRSFILSAVIDRSFFLRVCASLLFVAPAVCAQRKADALQDTIARIGTGGITARDFLRRLDLMPFPDKQKGVDPESLKTTTLRAMIAEKVLANETRRLSLPEDKAVTLMHHELENVLVRDELYRREIVSRIEVTRGEIASGMKRFLHNYRVLSFLVRDEEDGRALTAMLNARGPDTVLQGIPASLYTECDTLTIRFGAPDTAFENAAFALEGSRVSPPFSSTLFGWAVLYVLDRVTNPEAVSMTLADRSNRVAKVLRARRETELYERYYASALEPRHAEGDSAVFSILADSIVAYWKEDTTHFRSHGKYILTGDMVDILMKRLSPFCDRVLVTLDGDGLTLGEVLEMFRYMDFQSQALEGMPLKLELNETVRRLVGNEILAREGRTQGIQNSPSVRGDLELWSDHWAARTLYYRIRDSVTVTDDEILAHILKNKAVFGSYFEVNVREVLCGTLQEIADIAASIEQGRSLAELAREHSTRKEWAVNGGESGFFPVIQHPELGFRAMNADTGRLFGPVELPEGYSLFVVLGKRLTPEAKVNFEILKRNVAARLLVENRKRIVDRTVADLGRQQHVSIDYRKLKRLAFTPLPMFTRRLIGFGGRMSAAPMLMKQWDWIKEYQPPGTVIP